ncbi:MAG TPA: 3-isopropylmalate dehydratase small subunit [Vicinamibacterales bacterium]|nr:3-isopropylmalate dehydratase small subunit [Vicinamibacterales bacterium]
MSAEHIHTVEGRALPLRGEDIDTDRIMPARFLKSITFDGLEKHVFEDDRLAIRRANQAAPHGIGHPHPFDAEEYQGASILLVNRNFGAGSSREHAPQGLRRWGIRAIVAESFAEIFFGNSLMIGLACVTASPSDVDKLMSLVERDPTAVLKIDLKAGLCQAPGVMIPVSIPDHVRDSLMTGAWDTTGLLRDNYEQVNAVGAKLPYLSGF